MNVTRSTGYSPDWDIDLQWGNKQESVLAELFTRIDAGSTTVEVKADRKAAATGNIFVECMQKPSGADEYTPSGISTSTANYWVFIVGAREERLCAVMVQRAALYWVAQQQYAASGFVDGGTGGDCPTKGVLLKLDELLTLFSQSPL